MKGTNKQLVVTWTDDPITGDPFPLVAFPVQVAKATGSGDDVKFDRAAPSGGEYETCYRDTVTGELFEYSEMVRGVRNGDQFTQINDETIEEVEAATKSDYLSVERVVPLEDVPMERAEGRYFLQVPAKATASGVPFRALYEALLPARKKGKRAARPARAIRVKWNATSRQCTGVLYADPISKALVLVKLSFAAQLREPDEQVQAHMNAEVDPSMIEKFSTVLDSLTDEERGDWNSPEDELPPLRKALIEKALMGDPIEVAPKTGTPASDSIEAALAASLEQVA